MSESKLSPNLNNATSNISVSPSVLFEKKKVVNQDSGKVLLLTGITGLGYNLAPHFGMYNIHEYLKHHDLSSEMYDRDLEFFKKTSFTEKEVLENISKGEYDVIGISVAHNKAYGEQRMCLDLDLIWRMRNAASKSGKTPVFVGGGQAAAMNYKQWLDNGLDLIVLGYGEKTFLDICKKYFTFDKKTRGLKNLKDLLEKDEIRGVTYKNHKGVFRYTPALHVTDEMFRELFLKFPQKYEIPHQKFWDLLKEISANQSLGASEWTYENVRVYTTSHCPRMCGFCNSGQFLKEMSAGEDNLMINRKSDGELKFSDGRQKLVRLNHEELLELIYFYINHYGAKSFLFSDDDFALKGKDKRTELFCKAVIEHKKTGKMDKDVKFHCQTHVTDYLTADKQVNRELIKLMFLAGFRSISMGVETFTDGMIDSKSIHKQGYHSKESQAVLDCMLETGIVPQTNIILGVPEYSVDDLLATLDVAMKYLVKGCDIGLSRQLLALPGAPIYESGVHKVNYDTWKHPVTGKIIKVADYFEPHNPVIAKAMKIYDEEAKKELDKVVKRMKWGDKNPPKRVIALAGLVILPRLLGRDDLTPKYQKILDDVLAGKAKPVEGLSFSDI